MGMGVCDPGIYTLGQVPGIQVKGAACAFQGLRHSVERVSGFKGNSNRKWESDAQLVTARTGTALLKSLLPAKETQRLLMLKFYHTQLTSLGLCAHINQTELGMLTHTGKPSTQKAETQECEFKATWAIYQAQSKHEFQSKNLSQKHKNKKFK